MLAVVETHPVQYHAPIYRELQATFDIPVTAIYGSDFSVAGYLDPEFEATFSWDTDLLSGYSSFFLSRLSEGGAQSLERVSAKGLFGQLRAMPYQAVLLVGYSPRFHQHAWLSAIRLKIPIFFRGETTDHAQDRAFLKKVIRDSLLSSLYSRSTSLLYIGSRSREHFKRLKCPDSKLVFSPYCVSTEAFKGDEASRLSLRPEMRAQLGLSEDTITILFAGKLATRKGPDLLLSAVKRLPTQLRERISIVFLGEGKLHQELKAQSMLSPEVRCIFTGFQNQSRLSGYYHASDLLVMPSRHSETWGLVVNEALYHGVPVLISDAVGCAPDLVEPEVTGAVFSSDSAMSLAQALVVSLGMLGRPEIRENCRKKVGRYSVRAAAEGIAFAYDELKRRL